jgi:hypothetical protein
MKNQDTNCIPACRNLFPTSPHVFCVNPQLAPQRLLGSLLRPAGSLLDDRVLDTLAARQRDSRLLPRAEHEHVAHARGPGGPSLVLDVDDVVATRVLLGRDNGSHTANVVPSSDGDDVANLRTRCLSATIKCHRGCTVLNASKEGAERGGGGKG